ncbi:MAG: cupin domain-containing protein [Candidatus Omnitrophica bacterium]|nr:cupin domain-containing protein [Candidatus Omnitrophota bacterium]
MPNEAPDLIKQLQLAKHPEGGYFREVYRSEEMIGSGTLSERYRGERSVSTSIYFLLEQGEFSAFHRIQSDEIWHFYRGLPLTLYILTPQGELQKNILGPDLKQGQTFQLVIKRHHWFAAEICGTDDRDNTNFTLVGCTVAPGFDFSDFELADRERLTSLYPAYKDLITRLTH